jgi:hypothetical protein
LSKVESMEMPVAVVVRGGGTTLLSRLMRNVMDALHESRRRAALRVIKDYRRQCGD